jgi:hypothetical protein
MTPIIETAKYLTRLKEKKKDWVPSTRDQELANQIWEYFGRSKDLPFGAICGIIKMKKYQPVYEAFNEVRQSKDVKSPVKLFLWKISRIKTTSPTSPVAPKESMPKTI